MAILWQYQFWLKGLYFLDLKVFQGAVNILKILGNRGRVLGNKCLFRN